MSDDKYRVTAMDAVGAFLCLVIICLCMFFVGLELELF